MKKEILMLVTAGALAMALGGCSQPPEPIEQDAPPSTQPQQSNERQPLEVVESGYYVDEFESAHYAAIIENKNMEYAASMVNVKVTSKDAEGKIIGTDDAYMTLLFSNGKTAISGSTYKAKNPTTLEFQIIESPNMWEQLDMQQAEFDKAFYTQSINETIDDYGYTTVAGEVVNTGNAGFSNTGINVVFRDAAGAIVGGHETYLNDVPAGATVPFSVGYIKAPEHETTEVYVDCGYPQQ